MKMCEVRNAELSEEDMELGRSKPQSKHEAGFLDCKTQRVPVLVEALQRA